MPKIRDYKPPRLYLISLAIVLTSEIIPLTISHASQIKWQVIAEGTTNATSHGYKLTGTLGQPAGNEISSEAYMLRQGFWMPADSNACALCGDADGNNIFTISDAVYLIGYIFAGAYGPHPICRGDADGNTFVNVSDVVYLINYIFAGGPTPHCPA